MIKKIIQRLSGSENSKACLIIFLVLLLVYAIPLAMQRSQNPILQRAQLSGVVKPGFVSGQNTIDPNDGFTSQALGHLAANSLLSGSLPYWNYYEGIGTPLAAGMQSAAFSPFNLLQHFQDGFIYSHFLLQFLAGIFTFLFLRRLKLRFYIALTGGILFALSGSLVWLTNAAFNPVAMLPMMLLGVEWVFSRADAKKKGGWALLAITLALSLVAGFPETAFINALFAYGWAVVRLFNLGRKNRRPYLYKLLLGSVVGLLLAGPLLIAFVRYLPGAVTAGHGNAAYANYGLPVKTLPALFMPYIYGPIFGYSAAATTRTLFSFWSNVGGYVTVPLVLAALFGLWAKRSKAMKLYLAIFCLVAVLKIYGFRPIVILVNAIPGMHEVAFYRYASPALSLGLIILAMFGLEALLKSEITRKRIVQLTLFMSVVTVGLAVYSRSLLHQLDAYPSHRWWALASVAWALSIIVVIGLSFLPRRLLAAGVMALLIADSFLMFVIPYLSLPKMSPVDYGPVSYLQKNIGLNRFYTLGPIAPNYGSYFGLASININDLPVPKSWDNYIPQKLDTNAIPIIFTGYSRANPAGPTPLQELAANLSQYEDLSVKYLVTAHGQVDSSYQSSVGLKLVYSDPQVDIFTLPRSQPYYQVPPGCSLSHQQLNSVVASCASRATLVRKELSSPGWSASVNGRGQSTGTEGIFQTVNLPAGESDVKFSYAPPSIDIGYAMFGVGLLALLGQAAAYSAWPQKKMAYLRRTVKLK